MGWNKQSGDAWVLQRTVMHTDGQHDSAKALQLRVIGLLTIDDADELLKALVLEIVAARQVDQISRFATTLGSPLMPWQEEILSKVLRSEWRDDADPPKYRCSRCQQPIERGQVRLGNPTAEGILWEHKECPKLPPTNIEEDDGCPND